MNPNLLQTFLVACKHLNYTHTAEEVFLSQPAVSRQIKQLENELGVRLFEQIGKSLHLTGAGQTLMVEAQELLGKMERTKETVRAHQTAEYGRLRIGASTTPGLYLLPAMLGNFHMRFPKVELGYAVQNSHLIEQMIIRNELDLGFVGARLSNKNIKLKPFVEDEIICYANPSHPMAKQRRVSIQSLNRETWVTREKGSATQGLFESWFASKGGKIGKTILLHSPEAAKSLVGAGVGISFMSLYGLRVEFRQKKLKKLSVTGMKLRRPIYIARHADKHVSPAMEAFLKIVRQVC